MRGVTASSIAPLGSASMRSRWPLGALETRGSFLASSSIARSVAARKSIPSSPDCPGTVTPSSTAAHSRTLSLAPHPPALEAYVDAPRLLSRRPPHAKSKYDAVPAPTGGGQES